ncbi:MAG: hypothetical protein R3C12_15025 [Planctomycetaceae bacterium]
MIVIEHHLDVIKTADWVIDVGPEGEVAEGKSWCVAHRRRWLRHRIPIPRRSLRNVLPITLSEVKTAWQTSEGEAWQIAGNAPGSLRGTDSVAVP